MSGPHDLSLSLRVAGSFVPRAREDTERLRLAVRLGGPPVVAEVRQTSRRSALLEVSCLRPVDPDRLGAAAAWALLADLDLRPFCRVAERSDTLAAITSRLRGLKPMRPPTLFEMAVVAITEQQISMAAAHRIRVRLIERFGEAVEGCWAFPEPETLARASTEELRACGLSQRKADYLRQLARDVVEGSFDLGALRAMADDEARTAIVSRRGFGLWSANYILVRGLARPDCVPVDDLGVRSVVGEYLGDGRRASAGDVADLLAPFAPYRGLAAFYLLADSRLRREASTS